MEGSFWASSNKMDSPTLTNGRRDRRVSSLSTQPERMIKDLNGWRGPTDGFERMDKEIRAGKEN